MPVPHELLQAAFASLPETTLREAARWWSIPDSLTPSELVKRLGSDDGHQLSSYSQHMSIPDQQKVVEALGIDTSKLKVSDPRNLLSYAIFSFVLNYDKNRERDKFHAESGVPKLSGEELLAEVRKMARPCVYLTKNFLDGPFAGVWSGPGIVPTDAKRHKHWITIDCTHLPAEFAPLQLTGAASVYIDKGTKAGSDQEGGCVSLDPHCVFTQLPEPSIQIGDKTLYPNADVGMPLYALPGTSFPSQFQIIDYATPPIRDWLADGLHLRGE